LTHAKCLLPPSDPNYRPKATKPDSSLKSDPSSATGKEQGPPENETSKLAVEPKRKDKLVSRGKLLFFFFFCYIFFYIFKAKPVIEKMTSFTAGPLSMLTRLFTSKIRVRVAIRSVKGKSAGETSEKDSTLGRLILVKGLPDLKFLYFIYIYLFIYLFEHFINHHLLILEECV
jgi:hypothetical protein